VAFQILSGNWSKTWSTAETAFVGAEFSLFVWLVADGWCWFVLTEKYCWLVVDG
jgi:hypothetical protein